MKPKVFSEKCVQVLVGYCGIVGFLFNKKRKHISTQKVYFYTAKNNTSAGKDLYNKLVNMFDEMIF